MAIASKVTIEIAGNDVPGFLNLSINQNSHQLHDFRLVCKRDTFKQSGETPISSTIRYLGAVITILIKEVHTEVEQEALVSRDVSFKGIITEISASESSFGEEIIFSGHSPEILLHGYPSCRSFENMTLKQIAQEVLSPYAADHISLEGEPDTSMPFPYMVQYKETNYEFLRRLAIRYGEWFYYNGEKLVFGNIDSFVERSINGYLGKNITSYSVGTKLVPMNFKYASYFYGNNEPAKNQSASHDVQSINYYTLEEIGVTESYGGNYKNELSSRAVDQSKSSYNQESTHYFPGTSIKDDGTALPSFNNQLVVKKEKQKQASGMVVLNGSGNQPVGLGNFLHVHHFDHIQNREGDSGTYLIISICHTIDQSLNYQNSFTAIPKDVLISPDTNVNLTTHCESQSAIVKDVNDPQKLGRVRVRFHWQEPHQMSPWIRIASVYTGSGKGFYFVPEINEEVLVGFEGDNAEKPYVICSMRNSAEKPDDNWVTRSNDIKAIRSRSGHTIEFNDSKGNEELCIYNGTKKDPANMMRLKLSNNGYEIYSKGPISMTSGDNITIKGKNILLESTEYVDVHASKRFQLYTDEEGVIDITNKDNNMVFRNNQIHIDVGADGDFQVNQGGDLRIKGSPMGTSIYSNLGVSSVELDSENSIKGTLINITGGIVKINS